MQKELERHFFRREETARKQFSTEKYFIAKKISIESKIVHELK